MSVSEKASRFTESVIREMTRRAVAHEAVNLAQGYPDFPCPAELKDAACRAIQADVNQYAVTSWGGQDNPEPPRFRGPRRRARDPRTLLEELRPRRDPVRRRPPLRPPAPRRSWRAPSWEFDALTRTDESSEHIPCDGARRVTLATPPGKRPPKER